MPRTFEKAQGVADTKGMSTQMSPSSISAKMASVMMELTEEARAHMFGPWNPYFHVTKVLIDTMDRVSITVLD